VGRDPSSDLVLNDPKCSRHHAVIELTGDGITIRDNGSANGIVLNGVKTERSRIRDGDIVKLGDVVLTLVPEPMAGTVVMEELDGLVPRPRARRELDAEATTPEVPATELARPPIRRPPVLGTFRPGPETGPVVIPVSPAAPVLPTTTPPTRPLTVTVLVALWALSVPLYAVAGAMLSAPATGATRAALLAAGIGLAALSGAMAAGLWHGRRWAYVAQIAVAALGVFLCPFTLASIAVLVYMLRPGVQWHFSDHREREPESVGQAEPMFAGALVASVVLGVLLTAAMTFLARTARTVAGARQGRILARTPAAERNAVAQLTAMAAAEDAFHSVCNTGYGDLEGLRQPVTVIPDYPPDGPAFLRGPAFETAERDGYRYTLAVEDEMPPAAGCPTRRFRRFAYSATPLAAGRWLTVGSDGVVRAAEGRPATPDDPTAE
jgi:FHA domain-containing protein